MVLVPYHNDQNMLEAKRATIPTAPNDGITMLQNVTPEHLDCIGEIAHSIYHQTFPLLVQDLGYFDGRSITFSEVKPNASRP